MSVVPLAIATSLLLVAIFVGFFLYERRRSSQSSAEHDSLLPFAEETPRVVAEKPAEPKA
jgi:hypothetical protein